MPNDPDSLYGTPYIASPVVPPNEVWVIQHCARLDKHYGEHGPYTLDSAEDALVREMGACKQPYIAARIGNIGDS